MKAQIIISEDGLFLPSEQTHSLGKILNRVQLPTLPYVISVFSLVKLSYISRNEQYLIHIYVQNPQEEIIQKTEKIAVHNMRTDDNVPGVDVSFRHQMVLTTSGIHTFCLMVNGESAGTYPLGVSLMGTK